MQIINDISLWAKIFESAHDRHIFYAISADFDSNSGKKNDNFTTVLKIVYDSVIRQS